MPKPFEVKFNFQAGPISMIGGGNFTCRESFYGAINLKFWNYLQNIGYDIQSMSADDALPIAFAFAYALQNKVVGNIELVVEGDVDVVEEFAKNIVEEHYPTVSVIVTRNFDEFVQSKRNILVLEGDFQCIHAFAWIQLCDRLSALGAWKGTMTESLSKAVSMSYKALWYTAEDQGVHIKSWKRLLQHEEPPAWMNVAYYGYGPSSLASMKEATDRNSAAAMRLLEQRKIGEKPLPGFLFGIEEEPEPVVVKRKYVRRKEYIIRPVEEELIPAALVEDFA